MARQNHNLIESNAACLEYAYISGLENQQGAGVPARQCQPDIHGMDGLKCKRCTVLLPDKPVSLAPPAPDPNTSPPLQALEVSMQASMTAVHHHITGYEAFRDMVVGNRAFSSTAVQEAVAAQQLDLQGLRQLLVAYQQQLADVRAIPAVA